MDRAANGHHLAQAVEVKLTLGVAEAVEAAAIDDRLEEAVEGLEEERVGRDELGGAAPLRGLQAGRGEGGLVQINCRNTVATRGQEEGDLAAATAHIQDGAADAPLVCQLHEGCLRAADLPRGKVLVRIVMHRVSETRTSLGPTRALRGGNGGGACR